MRKILLAAMILGAALAVPGRASAGWGGCLGIRCGGAWSAPPGVVFYSSPGFYPGFYPAPVYTYPYPYDHSYFRPNGPYGWNGERNWRDTWQDDGVKVHGYTFR